MTQITWRIIESDSDHKTLVVTIPQFGYIIHYRLKQETLITTDQLDERGFPVFDTSIDIEFIKIEKMKKSKSNEQIKIILKNISIIPPKLVYDHILLGFVYSNDQDPNNFRWWLDFRDIKNQSIYNYYADDVEINCPITTTKWFANDMWHGRYVFSKNDLKEILQPKNGKLVINGKLRAPIEFKNICSSQDIPEKTESLRIRYNTRDDIWFCDLLNKEENEISTIPSKSIVCDARMHGQVLKIGDKPKVSTRINVKDISEVGIAINSLIIRGR